MENYRTLTSDSAEKGIETVLKLGGAVAEMVSEVPLLLPVCTVSYSYSLIR